MPTSSGFNHGFKVVRNGFATIRSMSVKVTIEGLNETSRAQWPSVCLWSFCLLALRRPVFGALDRVFEAASDICHSNDCIREFPTFKHIHAKTSSDMAVDQNQWYHFGVGEFTTHLSLFSWGLGCSPRGRDFDPWPYKSVMARANQAHSFLFAGPGE